MDQEKNAWNPQMENGVQGGAWVSASSGGSREPWVISEQGSKVRSENGHPEQHPSLVYIESEPPVFRMELCLQE